jgi:hypothetical protein
MGLNIFRNKWKVKNMNTQNKFHLKKHFYLKLTFHVMEKTEHQQTHIKKYESFVNF